MFAFVVNTEKELDNTFFSKDELNYIKTQVKEESKINRYQSFIKNCFCSVY
jgi:hypothetical protein